MNWQDYETLGHIEFKGKLVEYLKERTTDRTASMSTVRFKEESKN
jgi:hypothetical protein